MAATFLTGLAPTNLGPLTTQFTPPPSCTAAVFAGNNRIVDGVFGGGPVKNVAYLGQACSRGQPVDATSCWPETSKGAPTKDASVSAWGFYSPGLRCPTGYATACSATGGSGGKSDWPVQFRLSAGETAVGCCPSGYACANINGQTCIQIATSTAVPQMATCDGNTLRSGVDPMPTITVFAPMIQINFQSTDLPSSRTTNPLALATGTRTIDLDADPDPTGETLVIDTSTYSNNKNSPSFSVNPDETIPTYSPDSQSQSQGGLPSNVKVGLSVAGAAIGILALVFALFYFWRKKKNKLEDREMVRFYAGNALSRGNAIMTTKTNETIPDRYKGERLMTPTTSSGFMDGFRDSSPPGTGPREMMMPADRTEQRPMTPLKDGVGYYRGLGV